ncbi:MAG: glycine cleavage system aminomethyltransferase GcvT [Planctomycetaceae bacterium]|nr:glycine cleavage system aminomethyltransferase GcvT [Planctomycetaceae bacterium]
MTDASLASAPLAQTPLHDWHQSHGGRLVDFAGWSMPVQYKSIVEEHNAVRSAAGLFDVSHMGRLRLEPLSGDDDSTKFLDSVVTRRVTDMQPGQVRYSLITNDSGGILDDILVYRLQNATGGTYHLLVVNASNRTKIIDWLKPQLADCGDVRMTDLTTTEAMIAVQGPRALDILQPIVDAELGAMKYYQCRETRFPSLSDKKAGLEVHGLVSRTGYTGEDGWEIIVSSDYVTQLWEELLALGGNCGATACGLASRDTLRLEAGMPLYGHELTEAINPFQAGLNFAVNLKDRAFPGSAALAKPAADVMQPRRVGLVVESKRVPREGYPVLADGKSIGYVTSGTFSPTFNTPIAMAYVEPQFAAVDTKLAIDVRGKSEPCRVVALPFYRRS